jgi:hypothetical protein
MASTVHWLQHLISSIDQDTAPYRFEKDRLKFNDEVEAFRPLTIKAAEEATKISGTSSLSLWKLKQGRDCWNGSILDGTTFNQNAVPAEQYAGMFSAVRCLRGSGSSAYVRPLQGGSFRTRANPRGGLLCTFD